MGLSSTRILIVLARAPSDRYGASALIPIKNAITARLIQSSNMLCCVDRRIAGKSGAPSGNAAIVPAGKSIATIRGLGRRIASARDDG